MNSRRFVHFEVSFVKKRKYALKNEYCFPMSRGLIITLDLRLCGGGKESVLMTHKTNGEKVQEGNNLS